MLTQEIKSLLHTIKREFNRIVPEFGGLSINAASSQAKKTIELAINGLEKLNNLSNAIDDEDGIWVPISQLLDWQERVGATLQDTHNTGLTIDELQRVQLQLGDLIQSVEDNHER